MLAQTVAGIGRRTRDVGAGWLNLTRFVGALCRSSLRYPAMARGLWMRALRNQIYFTAVQAVPFLGTIAGLIGLIVIVQAYAQGVAFGFSDVLGRILASVVVRELGPLLTAIIVIGRSGTAIAAELATNTVLGETDALEVAGVDPLQYLVLPRVLGGSIATAMLTLFFNAMTLTAAALTAQALRQTSIGVFRESLRLALSIDDLWLMIVKGGVFGAGISLLCAYSGLFSGRKPTDIPRSVTRGVVMSLLFVFSVSAIFSLALYT
jgi:phospholipid/cholesterol/gamma-HCH transport system permease protein